MDTLILLQGRLSWTGSEKVLRDLKGRRSLLAGGCRELPEGCALQGGLGLTMHAWRGEGRASIGWGLPWQRHYRGIQSCAPGSRKC